MHTQCICTCSGAHTLIYIHIICTCSHVRMCAYIHHIPGDREQCIKSGVLGQIMGLNGSDGRMVICQFVILYNYV